MAILPKVLHIMYDYVRTHKELLAHSHAATTRTATNGVKLLICWIMAINPIYSMY